MTVVPYGGFLNIPRLSAGAEELSQGVQMLLERALELAASTDPADPMALAHLFGVLSVLRVRSRCLFRCPWLIPGRLQFHRLSSSALRGFTVPLSPAGAEDDMLDV